MKEMLNKLSFGSKLMIVILLGFVVGYSISAYLSIKHIENVYFTETIGKSRAITLEAESAREYIASLRKKYNAFDDVRLMAEVKTAMQGISGADNIINAAKKTSFYWTVPIVSGWNVAMMKAKEADYVFRVPKISPRNPANEPNDIEREMLLDMAQNKKDEAYRVDEKANALRFMRAIIMTEDCMMCHGNIKDSVTGSLKDPLGFTMEEWKAGEMHGAYEVVADLTPMQKNVQSTLRDTIIQAIITTGLTLLLIFLILKGLVIKPILSIVSLTKKVAEGDFTRRVNVTSNDEIGEISMAMNNMSKNLNTTINHVIGSSNELSSSAGNIKKRSEEIGTNAKEQLGLVRQEKEMIQGAMESVIIVNDNIDDLYRAAEDVSSAVEETGRSIENVEALTEEVANSVSDTSSAIEEMAVSIKNVANNTKDIVEAALETKKSADGVQVGIKDVANNASEIKRAVQEIIRNIEDLTSISNDVAQHSADAGEIAVLTATDAQKGREAMKKATLSMIKIKEVVIKSSEVISGLSKSAEDIGDIIDVIDDIAEQTNLLALNAAIEAARAGEHGRGFAVVADEVRKLAERSGGATKEIADLIKGIQGESEAAVQAMAEGTSEVEEGVTLAENSGKALESIISGVEKTENLVKQIATSATRQKTSSAEVSKSVSEVSKQVSQISGATQRLSQAGDDIVGKVNIIDTMSNQIASATEEQAGAANLVTIAVNNINDGAQNVKNAMKEQGIAISQIVQSVTSINSKCKEVKEASEHQKTLFNEVVEATNSLENFSNKNIETVNIALNDINAIVQKAESLNTLMNKFTVNKGEV